MRARARGRVKVSARAGAGSEQKTKSIRPEAKEQKHTKRSRGAEVEELNGRAAKHQGSRGAEQQKQNPIRAKGQEQLDQSTRPEEPRSQSRKQGQRSQSR